ncbi:hypothetical protein NOS3756_45080 [Nostoc sp. NIES-3756]|uniref:hypothetical protein n=1 Tax=Nostoc sp. NIES-3756 TaxID=1751286 RepID=UPI00071EC179|nr:hypothetical protein [Nostoc sp. NIES-3756]BAT55520.1 hypothetical protein NOS3756_45080 [Nostoc sp. NIES-3756]
MRVSLKLHPLAAIATYLNITGVLFPVDFAQSALKICNSTIVCVKEQSNQNKYLVKCYQIGFKLW